MGQLRGGATIGGFLATHYNNFRSMLSVLTSITLTGDTTGTGSFDEDGNLSISTIVVDDSHNHIVSNVDGLQTDLNLKANLASPTFTGTIGGISKSMVGLSNVDNTTDALKPVSTATQTALNLKANLASPTFTGAPLSTTATTGNNTTQIATTAFVQASLGAGGYGDMLKATYDTSNSGIVDNSEKLNNETKANMFASPTFTGTVGGVSKSMVGLGSVDNTTDALKPVSTAQQNAINLKANLANPTFTGTVGGISKSMVGLSNVDNTSDSSKPVSTAQQNAINLKANLASPTFTGVPLAPTANVGTNTTQLATTAYVQAELSASGGADITIKREEFTATASQSIFNLTLGSYTINSNRIDVYLWGIKQPNNAYTETNSTRITLSAPVEVGTKVLFEWIEAIDVTGIYSGHSATHATGGGDQITPAMIGASSTLHTHDDRYYTETEIDSALLTKSDTSHVHNYQPANTLIRNIHTSTVAPTSGDGSDGDIWIVYTP